MWNLQIVPDPKSEDSTGKSQGFVWLDFADTEIWTSVFPFRFSNFRVHIFNSFLRPQGQKHISIMCKSWRTNKQTTKQEVTYSCCLTQLSTRYKKSCGIAWVRQFFRSALMLTPGNIFFQTYHHTDNPCCGKIRSSY